MAERLSDKQLSRYKDQLTLAHRKFEAEAKPRIEKMAAYLRGDQWPSLSQLDGKTTGIPRVVANLIFADVKVMLPALALRNPRVFVKPTRATMVDPQSGLAMTFINQRPVPVLELARAKEALINWRWRELEITKQVRRCLIDALTGPFAVMKCGYTLETEKVEGDEELEPNELIRADSPFAVRWSPMDFRADPEARYPDLSDAGWVAFGWKSRVEDVRRNPRYRNTKGLKGTVELKTEFVEGGLAGPARSESFKTESTDEDWRRVQLWEVWDKRRHMVLTMAEDHDRSLQFDPWPISYEGFPCETLCLTEYPDTFYGWPDLWHVLPQQNAINELKAMQLSAVKRLLRKYIALRGAFSEQELAKLVAPVDGIVVETESADATSAIKPLDHNNVPVDWYTVAATYLTDHDRISGMGDFIRGVAEKVDTATEASLIQSNLSVRVNDTRALVETFAVKIARKVLQIDAQTLNPNTIVPVVGPDGALAMGEFVQISTRESLQAETDVEVELGSMQPINLMQRKADVLAFYGLARNDPLFDQFELRKKLPLAFADSIPDLDRTLIDRQRFLTQVAPNLMAGAPMGGNGGAPPAPLSPSPAGVPGLGAPPVPPGLGA